MKPPRAASSKWTFCNKEDETLLHLFYNCEYVTLFWDGFLRLWGTKAGLNVFPEASQIILGDTKYSILINFLILVAKRHIYLAKFDSKKPDLLVFKRYLQTIQKVEYSLALKKNKLSSHNKKWGGVLKKLIPTTQ